MQLSKVTFTFNGTWTAPAGVTSVIVTPTYAYANFNGSPLIKTVNGVLYSWGRNTEGQIGDGTTVAKSSPVVVAGNLNVLKLSLSQSGIALGFTTNSVVTANGDAYAWGYNGEGRIGDNSTTNKSSPVLVQGNLKFTDIITAQGSSSSFALGITGRGQLYAWGDNSVGQLGVGDVTRRSSPTLVLGNLTFSKFIRPGVQQGMALTSSGSLYAWGINNYGQLGDGTITNRSSPVLVSGGLTFVNGLILGDFGATGTSYGLTNTGDLYAWGLNASGELGDGTFNNKSSPILVSGGLKFVDIQNINSSAIVAIDNKGDAYSWGAGTLGQLGNGSTISRSSPVLVSGGLKWKKIITNTQSSSVLGLTTNNALYAWGSNGSGQLGLGDSTNRSSPVLVSGGLTFIDAYVTSNEAYGVTNNGLLYAWGANNHGQLGVGDVTSRSSPTLVLGNLQISPIPSKGTQQIQSSTIVSVTPGTTYSISFNAGITTFNNVAISYGPVSSITLSYEQ